MFMVMSKRENYQGNIYIYSTTFICCDNDCVDAHNDGVLCLNIFSDLFNDVFKNICNWTTGSLDIIFLDSSVYLTSKVMLKASNCLF